MKHKSPPEVDVPTYAKSGTESLKRHLVLKHDALEVADPKGGPGIAVMFPKAATVEEKTALVFAMNPGLPVQLVEDPFFIQAFGHPFSRYPPLIFHTFLFSPLQKGNLFHEPSLTLHFGWMTRLQVKCGALQLGWQSMVGQSGTTRKPSISFSYGMGLPFSGKQFVLGLANPQ